MSRIPCRAMATRGERWAFWLEAVLDERGWSRAEIAKRSRRKPNGRPVIDGSRVSEWLNKNEAPRDPEILQEIAHVLEVPVSTVLNAAGWLPDDELEERPAGPTHGEVVSTVADAIRHDADLLEEARQHLLNQYQLLRRLTPAEPSAPAAKKAARRIRSSSGDSDRQLRAVARGGDPKDRAEVRRLAKRAREEHDKNQR